jgi:hypothetical protein
MRYERDAALIAERARQDRVAIATVYKELVAREQAETLRRAKERKEQEAAAVLAVQLGMTMRR